MGSETQTSKYGITVGPGGIFSEMRPFEKALSLVLLTPMGLEEIQSLWARSLYAGDAYVLEALPIIFLWRSMNEPFIHWKSIKGWS